MVGRERKEFEKITFQPPLANISDEAFGCGLCRANHATRLEDCATAIAEIDRRLQNHIGQTDLLREHRKIIERVQRGFWACDQCVIGKRVVYPNVHLTSRWVRKSKVEKRKQFCAVKRRGQSERKISLMSIVSESKISLMPSDY